MKTLKLLNPVIGLLLLGVLIALSGCSILSDAKPVTTYVLKDNRIVTPAKEPHAKTLVLSHVRSQGFDDREFLVFANSDTTRGQYQYAQWSEKPSRRLEELLFSRLDRAQVYQTVAPIDGDLVAQHLLEAELLEFYHDSSTQPGLVTVRIRFALYDQTQHQLLSRRVFESQQPLSIFNAQGASQAFNVAVSQLLDDVVIWLSAVPSLSQE